MYSTIENIYPQKIDSTIDFRPSKKKHLVMPNRSRSSRLSDSKQTSNNKIQTQSTEISEAVQLSRDFRKSIGKRVRTCSGNQNNGGGNFGKILRREFKIPQSQNKKRTNSKYLEKQKQNLLSIPEGKRSQKAQRKFSKIQKSYTEPIDNQDRLWQTISQVNNSGKMGKVDKSRSLLSSYISEQISRQLETLDEDNKIYERNKSDRVSLRNSKYRFLKQNLRPYLHPIQQKQTCQNNNFTFGIKCLSENVSAIHSFQKINQQIKISDFQLGLCFDEDQLGKVYPARHLISGAILCIKQIRKSVAKQKLCSFLQSLKIQSMFSHIRIIQIYGVFVENKNIYVITQYFEKGQLISRLKSNRKFTTKQCIDKLKDLSLAISELHSKSVVVRNLQAQNISFFNQTCKISNFSSCSSFRNIDNNINIPLQFCSPEYLLTKRYEKQSDIWALGILFYQIVSNSKFGEGLSKKQIANKIQYGDINFPINSIDPLLCSLLQKMLIKDPRKRITPVGLLLIIDSIKKIKQTPQILK